MLAFHRPARLLSGSAVRAFHVSRASRLPAILHPDLQAYKSLREEKAWVESSQSKPPPTISSLRICIVNLMPLKESTELQLCRMLARSPVASDIAWVVPNTYSGKNSTPGHLEKFYKRFNEVKGEKYDGIILTGAPIEHLDFEQVAYWKELQDFFEDVRKMDAGILSLCWGAMASLWHFHGVKKHITPRKVFGVFDHKISSKDRMLAIPDHVGIPVSRHTTWKRDDIISNPKLEILLDGPEEAGPGLVWDEDLGHAHMINHFEYDVDTLDGEYRRDLVKGTPTGEPIHIPNQYYPGDDPKNTPVLTWQTPGQVFYSNWLNTVMHRKWKREGKLS
ncbi:hypothetical protein GUITHDRAFT_77569 [Guillardia theta CCMP2712]|uniref:Homoserine O-acetyltransferase n=1 Tax=Guillardia theta (strain CCMP2712) TaxID=905079 RepID=L1IPJ6_GUITC|nr:hypothetical protein GUITHDRAFT_77569 [Guillardia theta CCMP2712]EKX38007.1 hypothetical protein GUITHDRAFT_77569 [Guillardia theta CCMP2712]|eukprot:XP_005824987.1 hypothetical protein GUITHDRAFT_77569 [Guillardia theta CCMP2712]